MHKSEKFWRENNMRLNEKNYELLKCENTTTTPDILKTPHILCFVVVVRILVKLLETSKDPLVLSVAAFDIGEYVRHYPRGKMYECISTC